MSVIALRREKVLGLLLSWFLLSLGGTPCWAEGVAAAPAAAPAVMSAAAAPVAMPAATSVVGGAAPTPAPVVTGTVTPPAVPAGVLPPASPEPAKAEGAPESEARKVTPEAGETLSRFGWEHFSAARQRIVAMEQRIIQGDLKVPGLEQRDALNGFVGPLEMVSSSVYASIPDRYVLSPGDRLTATIWGGMLDLQRLELVLDQEGMITLPKAGKVVARGMTLDQLQRFLQGVMRQTTVKDLELVLAMDRLKSIQVYVAGEVFRPGSYAVSAVTTLFGALQACGGPAERGSLRQIRLLRGQTTTTVDYYDFLLHGDAKYDIPLQPGDTIFLAAASRFAGISGEVYQPGIYELAATENLNGLIAMARGTRPTALLKDIKVHTTAPNREKRFADVDLTRPGFTDFPLYDGDRVVFQPVLPEILNVVTLAGAVERPGQYELKPEMRLSGLFSDSNRPLGEAYLERVDIVRLNPDLRTQTLISVDLGKALAGDSAQNIPLAGLDQIRVFSRWDVQFIPPRTVAIDGAVQKPGEFERGDGMTLADLLFRAGGLLPNVYQGRADLMRYDYVTEMIRVIPVDLGRVLAGDPVANLQLADRDRLMVYAQKAVVFEKNRLVHIYGAVQRGGEYQRAEGMRLSDLMFAAGGVLPEAADTIEITRSEPGGKVAVMRISRQDFATGAQEFNPLLGDEDVVTIRSITDFIARPEYVTIRGEVAYSGTYAMLNRSERLSSLIKRAGGFSQLAYPRGTIYLRKQPNVETPEQDATVKTIDRLVNLLNPSEYEREKARNQYLLLKEVGSEQLKQAVMPTTGTVVSSGTDVEKAAAIGLAPGLATSTSATVDQAMSSYGPLPSVSTPARRLSDAELRADTRLIIDVEKALANPGGADDPELRPGDEITIPPRPFSVSVLGAVVKPATLLYSSHLNLEDYLRATGGLAPDGDRERIMVVRMNGAVENAVTEHWYGDRLAALDPGDMVYVAPKVSSLEIVEKTDKLVDAFKYLVTTSAGVAVFISLIGLF